MSGILKGRMGIIQRTIPLIEMNSNGNFVMRWANGMKLSKFIDYMGSFSAEPSDPRE
jgi:hypothetical protein